MLLYGSRPFQGGKPTKGQKSFEFIRHLPSHCWTLEDWIFSVKFHKMMSFLDKISNNFNFHKMINKNGQFLILHPSESRAISFTKVCSEIRWFWAHVHFRTIDFSKSWSRNALLENSCFPSKKFLSLAWTHGKIVRTWY